jgi:hypothetical protein
MTLAWQLVAEHCAGRHVGAQRRQVIRESRDQVPQLRYGLPVSLRAHSEQMPAVA